MRGKTMTGRMGNLRAIDTSNFDFLRTHYPSEPGEKPERIAERLLLSWLKHFDPNILGLRRVDEGESGRRVAMIHIAIPQEYSRNQLAQALGINEFADKQTTLRFNVNASAGWNEPHSYISVPAALFIAHVLDAIKERMLRPTERSDHAVGGARRRVQIPDRSRPNRCDENGRLRSAVKQALAIRNVAIEPHQIQLLTHRETGEKWVRIINVDRGLRTTIRLAIKRAGINAHLTCSDDGEGSDWSILFAANETYKMLVRNRSVSSMVS
jgi:hypothetical protein